MNTTNTTTANTTNIGCGECWYSRDCGLARCEACGEETRAVMRARLMAGIDEQRVALQSAEDTLIIYQEHLGEMLSVPLPSGVIDRLLHQTDVQEAKDLLHNARVRVNRLRWEIARSLEELDRI